MLSDDDLPANETANATTVEPEELEALNRRLNELIAAQSWSEAAIVGERLADIYPDSALHQRISSGLLLQAGRRDEALARISRAIALDPDSLEYGFHAGVVLNASADYRGAIRQFMTTLDRDPENADIYQQLAHAAEQMGHKELAFKLSRRAFEFAKDKYTHGMALAYMHARDNEWAAAADMIAETIAASRGSALLYRTLSGFLFQAGDLPQALAAIDAAIELDASHAEYHLHRGNLLHSLKRTDEARAALNQALDLAPANLAFRRHYVSFLVETDDIAEAVRIGAELLSKAPQDDEYAACMRYLLEARFVQGSTASIGDIAAFKAGLPPRTLREPPGTARLFATQANVISALVMRDIRGRHGKSKLGFLWAILEPFLHIGVLAIVFQFTMHGKPPLGDDYFLFYFTGVVPYLLLSHLIMHVGHVIKDSRHMMQISIITPFDLVVSKGIVELFTTVTVFMIFTVLFLAFGVDAIPVNPINIVGSFLIVLLLGTSLGMIYASFFEFGHGIEYVAGLVLRLLYFSSGIFYVPGAMPLVVRDILSWNPFLHVIDFMRTGYFPNYRPHWLDIGYAGMSTLILLTVSLAFLIAMSKHMRSHT